MEGNDIDPPHTLARAKFSFEGKNNDELTFNKNDVILITQQLDGGWWEGTLNKMTGWFPSNYVSILNDKDKLIRSRSVPNANLLANAASSNGGTGDVYDPATGNKFRAEVLGEFLASEKLYVESLHVTCHRVLRTIHEASVLEQHDYETLTGNIERIIGLQTTMLHDLELQTSIDPSQQRVGMVLLNNGAELKSLLVEYCWNHPRAVEVVGEKDEVLRKTLESCGLEFKALVMGLSEPFRHLDKYPSVLQELERCIPENHIDRGDIQRATAVYKEIKILCESARKQKECQLELLYTRQVEAWASFEERGRILYVGNGNVKTSNGEERDRCLVVFAKIILVLELTPQVNSYKLNRKISTRGATARKTDNTIVFGGKESFVFTLSSPFEVDRWLECLVKADGLRIEEATVTGRPPTPQRTNNRHSLSFSCSSPQDAVVVTPRVKVTKKPSLGSNDFKDFKFNHELEMIVPDFDGNEAADYPEEYAGSMGFLRPPAISRPPVETNKKGVKMRRETPLSDADDTILLRIIEGYCSGAARAENISFERAPQLIVAEDEKILVEEIVGDEVILQEKSLVDTVYSMKDQISSLRHEVANLAKTVEREQKARRRLEDSFRRQSANLSITPSTPLSPIS